ncbi:TetR family transcriptional regulator (plasmid) [Rhodococcus sp. USK10]|uniref:acyl-CoA-like ligand-binding transcription factor n=1 Tax=Rhodococcus sp. USK10 TaxID=2789739 RepID=UPI001C5FC96F|nr:TetR family transcriptional regulator [Rhodococcus sp. USK10]QYB00322.1 TetR family transcriptional regulator [Rhodococcus sp. USK10]
MQTPPRRSPGRPFAATRDAVERAALTLMLRDGYEQVSVDDIAREARIGRTTFFRYFKSKPGVVWSAFDDTISWLAESLTEKHEYPGVLDAVRESIVFSTRSAIYNSDVWLERFRLLDSSAELRADAYDHWERWASTVATFVATRTGLSPQDAIPMAIAGAARGMFLSELRNWLNTDDDREDILDRLDHNLRTVFTALSGLLAES